MSRCAVNAMLGVFPGHGAVRRALVCGLALWLPLAQADVFVHETGHVVSLTNVPVSDDYALLVDEPDVVLRPADAVLADRDRSHVAASANPSSAAVAGDRSSVAAHGDPRPFAAHLRAAAARHGVPEALLHAVIRVESNFNPRAVSPKGARGLMQLMPATARELGVHDPFDPAANIDGGARYLRQLLAAFGNDVRLAVAAYNAGPMAVRRWGGVPRYPETEQYVPRVLGHFQALGGGLSGRSLRNWR